MIHVVLDTSIYRSKPRLDSPEFKALGYLAKKECVQIHVPYVVEHEFASYLSHEHEKKINEGINRLVGLSEHEELMETVPELEQCLSKLTENKDDLANETRDFFLSWLDSVGAARYELNNAEAVAAMDAYFYGKPPLKIPKKRSDIPDSFIYQAVKALYETHGDNLYLIAQDKNLQSACQACGVNVYESLDQFIDLEEAKDCLKNALIEDNKADVTEQIMEYVEVNREKIVDEIESLLLGDDYRLIYGDMMPGESNEIYVSGVNRPEEVDFDDDIEHYGEGLFVLQFTAKVELIYEYAVYKTDILSMDLDKYHIEYLNDHYYNVETTDDFSFAGRLELEYAGDIGSITTKQELLAALQNPEITISELEDFALIVPDL